MPSPSSPLLFKNYVEHSCAGEDEQQLKVLLIDNTNCFPSHLLARKIIIVKWKFLPLERIFQPPLMTKERIYVAVKLL